MNKSEVLKNALSIAESHNYKGEMLATADGSTFLNRDQSCVNAALNHARQLGGDKALVYVIDNTGDEATCRDTTAGEFNAEYVKSLEAASMTGTSQDKRKQEQEAEVKRLLAQIEACIDQEQLDAITVSVTDEDVQNAISEAVLTKGKALAEAAEQKAADEKLRVLKAIGELDFPDHIRELVQDVTDEEVLNAAKARIAELEAGAGGEDDEEGETLNAKDTIELINACTTIDELKNLITEAEERKTVIAARDKKLAELTAQQ